MAIDVRQLADHPHLCRQLLGEEFESPSCLNLFHHDIGGDRIVLAAVRGAVQLNRQPAPSPYRALLFVRLEHHHDCRRAAMTLYRSATTAAATIAGKMKFSWLVVRLV